MDAVKVKAGVDPKLEKLYFMRELTKRTGILNEIQVMNLNTWPMVYTHATKVQCQFSYEDKLIVYDFLELGPELDQTDKRYQHLELSVKMLLGDEYSIRIFNKSKQLYPEIPDERTSKTPRKSNRKRKVSNKKVAKQAK